MLYAGFYPRDTLELGNDFLEINIMSKIECPRCKEETITIKQKVIANKWVDIYCSNCGGRYCANPILLALMSFVLTWVIIYFGFLAITQESVVFGTLFVVGWIIVEVFMYYIPLTGLKPKVTEDTTPSE